MNLTTYFSTRRGAAALLAKDVSLSTPFLWQCVAGVRKTPPDRCPAIERATDGRVTCEELRPDVRWQRVPDPAWPHAGGRPCIDVAAPLEADRAAA